MKAEEAYALSRKYTEDTIEGAGAVAGKPCQIQSITDITGGHRVTFLWLDNEGATHTSAMDVMDGAKGDKGDSGDAGLGIKSVAVNAEDHLIITYDDDTTQDAGQIQVTAAVDSVNGKTGDVVLGASDVGALPDDTDIPSKTSDLTNDSIVDSASYDSTNHMILFKNGTTTLFSLDATAFVKDGMVDDVEISGGNLVITFNTDAGKQAISIPLTDIFDPANYYDKDDVDGLLGDKADKVASATNGDFAGLDANGNLTDSGKKASDFGTADEIADIVNVYGSKNLLSYPYYESTKTQNGVTFTDNGDGTVTANGTATADTYYTLHSRYQNDVNNLILKNGTYTLTGSPSSVSFTTSYLKIGRTNNGTYQEYGADIGSGVTITLNGDDYSPNEVEIQIQIVVKSGATVTNLTFKPMLRLASIEDDAYVPYVPTNAKLNEEKVSWDDASESVQKNLLEYPYHETTVERNGITWTDLGDGCIKANGTATANSSFTFSLNETKLPAGEYLFTTNTATSGIADSILNDDSGNRIARGNSDLTTTTPPDTNKFVLTRDMFVNGFLRVFSGQTVSNLIFKPMIRKATIKDDTYQPYIPNNTQLTTWKANGVLGAKNLIPYPYHNAYRTTAGVTITEGSIKGSCVFNGTSTGRVDAQLVYINKPLPLLPSVQYCLSIKTSGSFSGNLAVEAWNKGTTTFAKNIARVVTSSAGSDSKEVKFSVTQSDINAYDFGILIYGNSGFTFDNVTVYPMLRLAEDTDDTYQPYAMTNQQITPYIRAITNPNLLDNPWFTVNQREVESWNSGVGVDRWIVIRGGCVVNDIANGHTITLTANDVTANFSYIMQRLPKGTIKNLVGEKLTFSMMLNNNSIVSHTFEIFDGWNNATEGNYIFGTDTVVSNVYDSIVFGIKKDASISSITIKAVKLEVGSVSTLAMDAAPNYATELLKCQRYFYRLKGSGNTYGFLSMAGYVQGANDARIGVIFPTTMRQSPTIIKSGALCLSSNNATTVATNIGTISIINYCGNIAFVKVATTDNMTVGDMVFISSNNDADAYIDFSADL